MINGKFKKIPKEIRDVLYTKNTAISVLLDDNARKEMITFFERLLSEKENEQLYGKLLTKGIICEMLVCILRCIQVHELKIGNALLQEALNFMQNNFKQPINQVDIAKHVHITPQYFSKLFKSEINITFHEYLRNMRLDYAMTLLNTTSMSVTDVCMEGGFNSVSNFTKIFKKRFGVLPKDVRKK